MSDAADATPSRALTVGLWIAQILLALAFLMAGGMKLATPPDELIANGMMFVERYGGGLTLFIGIAEVLGAIGLILPAALRIAPSLTGWAAVGLLVVMVLALGDHAMNGEPFVPNIVLGLLAAFVAWGRLSAAPIRSRGEA